MYFISSEEYSFKTYGNNQRKFLIELIKSEHKPNTMHIISIICKGAEYI